MGKELYLRAGELVHFSTGEYSDYCLSGSYVALADVTQDEVITIANNIKAKVSSEEEKVGWYSGHVHSDFQAALVKEGWLLSVQCTEHHIGSYSQLEVL